MAAVQINRPPLTMERLSELIDKLWARYDGAEHIPPALWDLLMERAHESEDALQREEESRDEWLSIWSEWPANQEGD